MVSLEEFLLQVAPISVRLFSASTHRIAIELCISGQHLRC